MPFSPTDIANCKLWLEASAGVYSDAGITAATNGGSVQQWNDQSGSGNHCTQLTAGKKPTFNTTPNRVNFARAASQFLNNPYIGEPAGFACVLTQSDSSGYAEWGGGKTSETSQLDAYYLGTTTNDSGEDLTNPASFKRVTSADAATGGTVTDGGVWVPRITGSYYISFGRFNGTRVEYGVNGAILAANDITGTPRAIAAAVIGAGYFSQTVTDYSNSSIQELVMYSVAPSDSQMESLLAYLAAKYSITLYTAPPVTVNYYALSFLGEAADHSCLAAYQSQDGVAWQNMFSSYDPGAGKWVRDPGLLYYKSEYWAAHTNDKISGGSFTSTTTFSLAKSADMQSWSHVVDIDCSAISPTFIWAPCLLDDTGVSGNVYAFFTNSTAIYVVHATDLTGLATWSAPSAVAISGQAGSLIDPESVVKTAGTYALWYASSGGSFGIGYGTASSATGTYTMVKDGETDWAGWIAAVATDRGVSAASVKIEGPTVRLLSNGTTWRIWFDAYNGTTRYGTYYSDSTDGWVTWSTAARCSTVDGYFMRHGSVILKAAAAVTSGLLLRRRRMAA